VAVEIDARVAADREAARAHADDLVGAVGHAAVDLTFHPEGERRQDKDLIVAASRYVQPIGVFRGTLRCCDAEIAVDDLPGVTEDHRARW